MKILFFTKGDKCVGSSRQRIWFIAERLNKEYGIDYEVIHSIKYSSWLFWSRTRRQQISSIKSKIKAINKFMRDILLIRIGILK